MLTNDLYARVTAQIADAVEAGAGTFKMPWRCWGEGSAVPINAITGTRYSGINILLLWASCAASGYSSGRWATYRQWTAAGAQVRKGETATAIIFWKKGGAGETSCLQANSQPDADAERYVSRVFSVFNADQVDGDVGAAEGRSSMPAPLLPAADGFFASLDLQIAHGGDRSFYDVQADRIRLPHVEQFDSTETYAAVLAHEVLHWSGADKRLNRELSRRFGTEAYAAEELIAELGAAFLCARLGISPEPRPDHAAYISSWLTLLRSDPRAIMTAASHAQKAVDYLVDLAVSRTGGGDE